MEKLKKETIKLLNSLEGELIEGSEYINEDGVRYRHDHFKNKYMYTPRWLSVIFERACKASTGDYFWKNFSDGNYSFHFDREKFIGKKDRAITYSKLVILGD